MPNYSVTLLDKATPGSKRKSIFYSEVKECSFSGPMWVVAVFLIRVD
jgi:hypothetical protein